MTYSKIAKDYLIKENFPQDRVINIGSPMYEVISNQKNAIKKSSILKKMKLKKNDFFLISTHREENVENNTRFKTIMNLIFYIRKKLLSVVILELSIRLKIKMKFLIKK